MKEIGGYFQLEHLHGAEYHEGLLRLNLGRTALTYALHTLPVKKLYLPRFICDSVTSACKEWAGSVAWYSVSNDFLPVLSAEPSDGTYVYVINYYGQLTNETILSLKKKYGNIIVDNTHSFFQRPVPGIPTLYSCRKFFGLPDGAYLYLPNPPSDFMQLPQDSSNNRMAHILGRYEHNASSYYPDMLETAESFYQEPVKRMSPLTENLLRGIDYSAAGKQRAENYRILDSLLCDHTDLTFTMPEAPFVYPFYTTDAAALKKQLASRKIFVPTYWNNVIKDMPENTTQWNLASYIMPLPVDQRYSPADMEYMASILLPLLQSPGGVL